MGTPADRVAEEGGSATLVRGVAAAQARTPWAAATVGFLATVYARYARHRGSVLAGGLAFFGLLSLVPAFLSMAVLASVLVDPAEFAEDLSAVLVVDPERAEVLDPAVQYISATSRTTLQTVGIAGVVSLLMSLYAASRFVYVGRQVLDVAFELEPEPPNLISRGMAVLTTLAVQGAVVVGVLAAALVPELLELLGMAEPYGDAIRLVRLPVAIAAVYLMLTAAMRFGIRARRVVRWWNVGGAVGTSVIVLGTAGLNWYLSVSVTYGTVVAVLGGVIAVEIWLYLIGVGIVVSAEIEGIRHGFRRRDRIPA